MAHLSDLPLKYRLFMRAYPYRQVNWRPASVLAKPLAEARIAVVTTAAFHHQDQPAFDEAIRGGDPSFRILPADVELSELRIAHRSDAFDASGIEADKNLALPLDRLRELGDEGRIGGLAPRHLSFMGSISAPGRLIAETAPAAARLLRSDAVDGVLLTPV